MKYVIFGAGQNGFALARMVPSEMFLGYIDNDSQKWGGKIGGLEIHPVHSFLAEEGCRACTVVFTFASEADEERLRRHGVRFVSLEAFLLSEEIVRQRDAWLFDRYRYDTWLRNRCFPVRQYDAFRGAFCNPFNEALVRAMQSGDHARAGQLLTALGEVYERTCPVDEQGMYFDEYYDRRFDMRLIRRLLSGQTRLSVCDLACGHGELLRQLKGEHRVLGVDLDEERVAACRAAGMEALVGDAAVAPLPDASFDVVISEENLEHVADPLAVLREAWRLLRPGGRLYVSVPLGRDCDDQEHVRFFSVNLLYSLLRSCRFTVENIITIPYVNENLYDNNIFAGAVKAPGGDE